MKKYILIFIVSMICWSWTTTKIQVSDKETIKRLILQSKAAYEEKNVYNMGLTYTLYNTPTSNEFSERYSGVSVKNGSNLYSKIDKTEFIQINKTYIKIDNESKLVSILENTNFNKSPFEDLASILKHYDKFDIHEDTKQWICTLTAPEVTFTPYGKIIIYISKKDYTIKQQDFFLLHRNEFKDKSGKIQTSNPRLVVKVDYMNEDLKNYIEKLTLTNYFSKQEGKIKLSKQYQQYQIID